MKPTLLAIDTSTENCSVALQVDNTVISREMESPREHSQRLLPFVQAVLEEADIKLSDVDGLIVGIGPGSFTGVRIGVSIAQGLAFGASLKVNGVSSLDAMALEGSQNRVTDWIISAIDARMGEVYWRVYQHRDGHLQACATAKVDKPEQLNLAAELERHGYQASESIGYVGTGWETYREQLAATVSVTPQSLNCVLPTAEAMLRWAQLYNEPAVAADELEPLYVRNEVTWKKLPGR
ncbi:MAG TPA: tRNA (adenosine(37)-N6)-threonylcarbamoyltransferase complex dimerization subunit type 1 TsaB [Idiomarina baltica]|uniref:tRNA threonylcarbamoyladenosine biosynthesis protein TsaB n=1 Tax=Idiomarina baltica TaxID=190892 RepID=A0A348WPR8_9GAMM|nr:tRNA (adenosine(37)-N6)-threonylcarbamoyltransferase complex dimerization subunit type 1 TsaB [Idiomarina sp. T82-3]KXS35397.1 MAG: Inactive metal-dependent protease-like protein [Idiomarina sp. T82-3]HAE90998.1 tRNA (adenosine(37)-N6)-threonylcarbamoyltransferase complex dimerization subunit type 1 TsaB [Idiomarina sp.]HAR56530.1 tRNA (adenosine(37)-N6)-threonylcarbamoyltransferase complex dimerization subunit type 1 TsaB [Idiomarina baltica]|tara:strand:+ start:7873 stop:8583 length:711 start_codon:yes stop_codon:yes gene_type:complete